MYHSLIEKIYVHAMLQLFECIRNFLNWYIVNIIGTGLLKRRYLIFFSENKRILLFLIETKIITIDEEIYNLMQKIDFDKIRYCHFFYPQIKSFIKDETIKNELLQYDFNIFDDFEQKQKNGENESIICSLIRNDLVEDFIRYITQNNISLLSRINPSLFETNSLLIGKKPSLIEYASFYGSIEIFKYLYFSKVELESTLWIYIIHSKS